METRVEYSRCMYHAEFGVFQGADVVLSEMRSCVNAATTFNTLLVG